MQGGELPYTLVPSLDGSLFMLEIEKGLLHPVPLTADISRVVDDVAVTGGSLNSKTGVNPVTGEVVFKAVSPCLFKGLQSDNLHQSYKLFFSLFYLLLNFLGI